MRNTGTTRVLLWALTAGIGLCGCSSVGLAHESTLESTFEQQELSSRSAVGMYDSADTAVVLLTDTEEKKISLLNIDLNKSYTLDYDGTTMINDKYGIIMSMPQVRVGDVVHACFMKDTKKLVTLQLSPEAFVYEGISRYSVNGEQRSAMIGADNYRLQDSTLIVSEGRRVEASDIISKDVVTMQGIGHSIYSILVEKGHGYLRLKGDAYVIGGWIEVGQSVIQEITEDMLLTVPEGSFEVHITAPGVDIVKQVTIERNKEAVIDLSDIVIEKAKMGKVYFTVKPEKAAVYVDGEKADMGKAVEMEYGVHQIRCEAAGYDTVTQHIKVSQEIASVAITLEEERKDQIKNPPAAIPGVSDNRQSGVSGNGLSGSSTSDVSGNSLVTGLYRVYIDSPAKAEVYQDNIYMGISPVGFAKVSGTHTITLRRTGYITKSYTVQIDSRNSDVTYSFTDLEKVKNTVSDNGVSDNETSDNNEKNDEKDKNEDENNQGGTSDNSLSGNSL